MNESLTLVLSLVADAAVIFLVIVSVRLKLRVERLTEELEISRSENCRLMDEIEENLNK